MKLSYALMLDGVHLTWICFFRLMFRHSTYVDFTKHKCRICGAKNNPFIKMLHPLLSKDVPNITLRKNCDAFIFCIRVRAQTQRHFAPGERPGLKRSTLRLLQRTRRTPRRKNIFFMQRFEVLERFTTSSGIGNVSTSF